jgi:hypothetical protein
MEFASLTISFVYLRHLLRCPSQLPQSDRRSGRTYYFNLTTGAISASHPFQEAVDTLRHKQFQDARQSRTDRRERASDVDGIAIVCMR